MKKTYYNADGNINAIYTNLPAGIFDEEIKYIVVTEGDSYTAYADGTPFDCDWDCEADEDVVVAIENNTWQDCTESDSEYVSDLIECWGLAC